jgi:hypothetical protein
MTHVCADRLTTLDAVIETHLHLECSNSGWTLWERHRHIGGLMTDCPASEYQSLTIGELLDILEATLTNWVPLGGAAALADGS